MRTCTICKNKKPLTEFYNRWFKCKPCWKQSKAYEKNYKKRNNYRKNWDKENQDKILEYRKKFKESNPNYMNEYMIKRREQDPIFKISSNMRTRLGNVIRAKTYTRQNHLNSVLGIDWDGFKNHISSLFTKGMNWDNYGDWEIDHITPLYTAKDGSEVELLFHYQNLQPLWKRDNRKKHKNI
tara:strand:+ start:73 stop:618 length:546 start_codon:yes stop_codon:yes gene_type:complete